MSAQESKSTSDRGARNVKLAIGFIVAAVAVYLVVLGRQALSLITDGRPALLVMGLAVLVLPLLGAWMIYATLRSTFDHDRLARRIFEDGQTMDLSQLPKRPSGRVEREAADWLFAEYKAEWEADPDNWRTNYQLARAYDIAGDRGRARQIMHRAVALESAERKAS